MSVMILFTLKQVFSYTGLGSVLKFAQVNAEVRESNMCYHPLKETFTKIKKRILRSLKPQKCCFDN